jgi:hypothetical protein
MRDVMTQPDRQADAGPIDYRRMQHDPADPDPWLALYLDTSLPMDDHAKEALLRGQRSYSRRILLPIVRPIARLCIVLVQLLRIILPERVQSSRILHYTIYWGLKYFVSRDANYLILRHFNIGTQVLKFIGDNVANVDISTTKPLYPKTLEALKDDVFLIHDLNIFNFIIELNRQLDKQGRNIEKPERINFDAIRDDIFEFENLPDRWHNFIDLQTAIELYTPMYALFLSDRDFWRAANSLQLDETIAVYISRLFGTPLPLALVHNGHPTVPESTLRSGFRLMLHGLDAETVYGFIRQMRDMPPETAPGI